VSADERVDRGMQRLLALRHARLAAGARQVGWKLGFGSPPARAALQLDEPLVGFLLDEGMLPDGATVSLDGWRNPMLEAEIAVRLGPDGSIAGVSAAIELADLHPMPTGHSSPPPTPTSDVEEILAGAIYTRHVVLGPVLPGVTTSDGVLARIDVDGAEVAATDDVTELVGRLADTVRSAAATLARHGESLRDGDFLMSGSVFPPLPVQPGQRVDVSLEPLGRLGLTFA
jgi:2-keto-4-pentenoate hydratase